MASQFFQDFIQVQKEIGKSTVEAIDAWIAFKRKRDKDEIKKKLDEIRHAFCKKFGFDESLSDTEISVEIFMARFK